ncbi:hypothetical protein JI667_17995 [Bacillus sp. NTK074B]|uniref:hypothetical protein n=1 Tax=Bacillus sp. NTK074B TaxID=2802174 RepID=UPI001A8FB3CF|nr:hypothetical protein [Bacillus sp. NTK074B]
MKSYKRIVFLIIVSVSVVFTGYPYVQSWMGDHNDKATEIELDRGVYTVGDEIEPGFYDIISQNDHIQFMQRELSKGDKVLGIKLHVDEKISVQGKGAVTLVPASFDKIESTKGNEYVITHSGFYDIGKQLPEGEYQLSYSSETDYKEQPLVQILKPNGDILHSYYFDGEEQYTIHLKEENTLEVNKFLFTEAQNVEVKLKLIQ